MTGKIRVSIVATALDGNKTENKTVLNMFSRVQNRNTGYSENLFSQNSRIEESDKNIEHILKEERAETERKINDMNEKQLLLIIVLWINIPVYSCIRLLFSGVVRAIFAKAFAPNTFSFYAISFPRTGLQAWETALDETNTVTHERRPKTSNIHLETNHCYSPFLETHQTNGMTFEYFGWGIYNLVEDNRLYFHENYEKIYE